MRGIRAKRLTRHWQYFYLGERTLVAKSAANLVLVKFVGMFMRIDESDEMLEKKLSYMWLTKRFKLTVSLELRIYVRIKNEDIGELKDYDP